MDTILTTAALASAEKIIHLALNYDPATRIALGKLAPQILAIKITAPEITFYIAPTAEKIHLLGYCEASVSTQIQGTALALLSLLQSDSLNLKDTGVSVTGNTVLLADLHSILKNLDIDWEEILSQLLGDILGHQSAQVIRQKMAWVGDRAQNIQRLTREFLTEELHTLPSKPEIHYFNEQVDDIRLGVDRIEARLTKLAHMLSQQSTQA